MKITFVSYYDLNDRMAAAARMRRMVEFFKTKNWDVELVTPKKKIPKNKLSKLTSVFEMSYELFTNAKKISDTDIYYISSPPVFMLFPCYLLEKATHKPVVIEERDLLTINPLLSLQWLRGNPLSRRFEYQALKKASLIVTPTIGVKSDLEKKWKKLANKSIVIRNGFWKKDYASINPKPGIGPLTLIHTGNFYGSRNPLPLLEALNLVLKKHPKLDLEALIRIRFIGQFASPQEQETFLSKAKEYHLDSVFSFEKHLPYTDSLKEIAKSDISLLITHDKGSENAIPAKLFEYIAIGKPILAITSDPLVTGPIYQHNLGWCFSHSKIEELSHKLYEWIYNPNFIRNLKLPGLELSEYDSEKQLEILNTHLQKLL